MSEKNAVHFTLLLVINLFVGAMVGLERNVLPLLGQQVFGMASVSAALSFIISFGFSKALVNLFAGWLADQIGRKQVLIAGWSIGLFVPILIILADHWWQIVFANILLGINQGLTWSMTVNMKIDLVKPNQRGLAIGLNEFAGYTGVAITTALSSLVALRYSLMPEPFYLGIVVAVIGLVLSFLTKEQGLKRRGKTNFLKPIWEMLAGEITKNKTIVSASFAGFITNTKDGMAWGLLPSFFLFVSLPYEHAAIVIASYPATWGMLQLFTGALSDTFGRKPFVVAGMILQSAGIFFIAIGKTYGASLTGAIFMGMGTAFVYPTLQAIISDVSKPEKRASVLGVYRFWRDSGYAFGALIAGVLTDILGITSAILIVACLPLLAAGNAMLTMEETVSSHSE